MSITGQTFLHYRIIEKIGEGGMGAVYKAEDTHLDRIVAVKVLPHEKVADEERRQRFVQEAKAASSLNHPNIIVVHDIASDQGLDFMVMEYVEGRTLDQLIGRKGMKLNEALGCAVQIADGLAKAHGAGIVHRDLKPTNIMVTEEGRVKILDFGLAKLIEETQVSPAGATVTLGRPEAPKTEEGFILGTMAYMSPEQAEGKKIDARSDVFSFGSVLYEMLTGQKAFQRETRLSTLAAILNEDLQPSPQLDESLPREITQALARCLRKDPQRRWQNMSDLKVVLEDLKEDSESGKLRAPQARAEAGRRRIHPLMWLGMGAVVVAAAAILWLFIPKPPSGPPEYEITRLTFDSGLTWAPAISPDGTMFACAADREDNGNMDIWLQQLAGGPPLRLTTHPAADDFPTFSPDGSRIVFQSKRDGGGIYEIATLGGQPRRLLDYGLRPRYSPDGTWIAFITFPASLETRLQKMFLIPAQGGDPVPFQPEFCILNLATNLGPVWSPDGQHLIFNGRRIDDQDSVDWWVAPAAGGPAVRTNAHRDLAMPPIWQSPYSWAGSYIYYATGTTVEGVNLFRVEFDESNWKVKGPAERITSGPGMQFNASALEDGSLVYANLNWIANIWTLEADTNLGLAEGEPVTQTTGTMVKFYPSVSRDGTLLVYSAFGGLKRPRSEVRLKDLVSGEESIVQMRAARTGQVPKLSPDGSTFSYRDLAEGGIRTFIVSVEDMVSREVCDSCEILDFFPDANFALIKEGGEKLLRFDISTGEKTLLLEAETGLIKDPAISPDGRWISFVHGKPDGRVALYVAPLTDSITPESDWTLVFEEDRYLGSPAWSPDGNRLYYLSERDGSSSIWTQKLDPESKLPNGDTQIVYRASISRRQINLPPGNGRVAVAEDKLVFWMAEGSGNIYLATPKKK
jgi:Tol biopolymer transport system component/tRNA A-37 threonylcarbamoyl transferase component Bud32